MLRLPKDRRGARTVDFAESMKQQTFDHGEAICNFQQYSVNEPRNQVVRSTLARLAQPESLVPMLQRLMVQSSLALASRNLNGVDIINLDLEFVRRLVVAHNENDYRLILWICELIAMRQMPLETEGIDSLPNIDRGC